MAKRYEKETRYILDCIDGDGFDIELNTDKEKAQHIYDRFQSEYGWNIKREGEFNSLVSWLQGLAINIAFTNYDIIQLAKVWGSLPQDANEKQEDKILDKYWRFMAMRILGIWRKYKVTA